MELDKVVCGDCLDVMRTMPDKCVDLVVTDPPYGQSNEDYDGGTSDKVWEELFRIASENAVCLSFAGSPTYHRIAMAIENAGWNIRQMWAWIYRDGFITSAWPKEGKDRLAPAMDPIVYATKGKVLLNLKREGTKVWKRLGRTGRPGYSKRDSTHGVATAKGHWPRSVVVSEGIDGFQYFILSRSSPGLRSERVNHPNQKPLGLLLWLISKIPGMIIFDPFMGSGTTAVAALKLNRHFYGCDINPEYVKLANERIEKARLEMAQLELP